MSTQTSEYAKSALDASEQPGEIFVGDLGSLGQLKATAERVDHGPW